MKHFLILLFACSPLLAEKVDASSKVFEQRERRHRVDVYDFDGDYPDLERVDIDGKRKKNVEIYLTGNYPQLRKFIYDGGFGTFDGDLTGDYPKLTQVDIACGSANMNIDLRGTWHKNCTLNISGEKEQISITLPEGVGIVVNSSAQGHGKVIAPKLQKQGRFKIRNKTFHNDLVLEAPIVLTLNISTNGGQVMIR